MATHAQPRYRASLRRVNGAERRVGPAEQIARHVALHPHIRLRRRIPVPAVEPRRTHNDNTVYRGKRIKIYNSAPRAIVAPVPVE